MFLAVLPLLLTMTRDCGGQPILPSLSYPVFMVVPSQDSTPASPLPEEGFEFSQFHSQDEHGRVVFGFHGPDQSRMEARALDGSVRGSYSYIDPYGHIVKMQYWDDGAGFHVAGNALPGGESGPQYTPEVAAARKEHLRIYKQTLAAVQQMLHNNRDENTYADSPVSDPALGISQYEDYSQYHNEHEDNNLLEDDKDSVSLENPELITGWHVFHNNNQETIKRPGIDEVEGEVDLGEVIGPDDDIDEFENEENENDDHKITENDQNSPEKSDKQNEHENDHYQPGQFINNRNKEENDEKISDAEDDSGEDDANIHNGDNQGEKSDGEESDRENESTETRDDENAPENDEEESFEDDYDPENSENRNTELRLKAHPIIQPPGVRKEINKELRLPGDQIAFDANDYQRISPNGKRRGFYYHFQHIIPKPTEKIEEAVEQGMKSAAAIRLPPTGEQEDLSIPHYSNPNYYPHSQK